MKKKMKQKRSIPITMIRVQTFVFEIGGPEGGEENADEYFGFINIRG